MKRIMWRRIMALLLPLLVLFGAPEKGLPESAGCTQARAIVAEVGQMHASGTPDHARILEKLKVAQDLCPTMGDVWKYLSCSAQALGKEADARRFRDRAIFNGVTDPTCSPGEGAVAVRPVSFPVGPVRAKHALVIGIGRFRDPKISTLHFTAKDAEDLATVLKDPRYGRFDPANVTVLTDEQATRANILSALNKISLNAQENDLVFLYVSSHGSPPREDQGLGNVGYIVTHDAALDSIFVEGIDYQDFSNKVALVKARRKVVFLDTCFSGQASRPGEKALFVEPSGVDPRTAQLFLSGEGTYVITSSKANQRSFESDTLRNSYFTYYLMEALRKEGDPPTVKEVFDSLVHEVPMAVAREKGQPQQPQIFPARGPGDLRIGVAPLPQP
jgi:hypothetical protein